MRPRSRRPHSASMNSCTGTISTPWFSRRSRGSWHTTASGSGPWAAPRIPTPLTTELISSTVISILLSTTEEIMKLATGRWVCGNDFVDRESELRVLDARVRAGNHILLTGQRRMGKTSIARELGRRLVARGMGLPLHRCRGRGPRGGRDRQPRRGGASGPIDLLALRDHDGTLVQGERRGGWRTRLSHQDSRRPERRQLASVRRAAHPPTAPRTTSRSSSSSTSYRYSSSAYSVKTTAPSGSTRS